MATNPLVLDTATKLYILWTTTGSGTVVALSTAPTLTAPRLGGSTSGSLILTVPAVAGSNTFTFPAGTTDLSGTGGSGQVIRQEGPGAALTVGTLAANNLSNGTIGSGAVVLASGSTLVSPTLTATISLERTITAGATTGAQTINKPAGSVNFAAAATSLVVTNSLVTANSLIFALVLTNDATMKSVLAVAASGSFTLYPNANPTAETKVGFLVTN